MWRYSERYLRDLIRAQTAVADAAQLRNKRIFITGANGLICSTFVDVLMQLNDSLQLGMHVYGGVRNMQRAQERFNHWMVHESFSLVPYDAEKPIEADARFDYMIHGASGAAPGVFASNPVEVMTANLDGMKHVLDYARAHGIERVLYISSSEVYGKKSDSSPYDEDTYYSVDILNPRCCYPSAKRAAETLCAAYGKEYGVDAVIVRPGHIYGPAFSPQDDRASSVFAYQAAMGEDIVMKSMGNQLRSYCYALDCATAILMVLLRGQRGEAYNISNPASIVTIRQLAECLAQEGGVRVVHECATREELGSYNPDGQFLPNL